MNGLTNKIDIEEFKKLSQEQQNYIIFSAVIELSKEVSKMKENFSAKWVEKGAIAFIALIIFGFFGTVLYLVGWHSPPNS